LYLSKPPYNKKRMRRRVRAHPIPSGQCGGRHYPAVAEPKRSRHMRL
jgi:hypothetical protein